MPDPADPTRPPPRPHTGDGRQAHPAVTAVAVDNRPTHWRLQQRLDDELTTVRAELARVDAKTSTLLGLAGVLLGGGLAVLGSASHRLPVAAAVPAWTAAAAVGAAVVLLAVAVRPNLRGNFGFVRWCRSANAQALLAELTAETAADPLAGRAGQLRWLSVALLTKYTAVRRAVTLLVAGLGGGVVAAAAAMWIR